MKIHAQNYSSLGALEDGSKDSPVLLLRTNPDPEFPVHPIDDPQIQEELVIEEVSIDGMCGVY